ncbi:MAG: hypothetical protein COC22_00210 [Flavobacteriaceae bacterium]|nr:MAG: hypothetical protein COC22_00210 [Flavobacteriaceae bacterium]
MASPDISSGLSMTKVALIATLAVGVIAGAGYGFFTYSDNEVKAPDTSGLFNSLPSDYFTHPEDEVPPSEIKKVKPKAHKKTLKKKAVTYSQAVVRPQIDYEALREEQLRNALNAKRRGASESFVRNRRGSNDGLGVKWINTDENYKGQVSATVGRETSFPVDLSRTLTTDRNISAVLVDSINSELPGKIRAQIDSNIYALHGRKILIPAGSMAVGQYAPLGKVGDRRIRAIWTRILRPDGVNIVLSGAEMADAMGRSGLTGEVDNRMWERFGTALLVSTVTTASQYSIKTTDPNQINAINNFSRDTSQASAAILEQNIDLRPIVEIEAGTIIQITPVEDIWFKKPIKNVVYVERLNKGEGI